MLFQWPRRHGGENMLIVELEAGEVSMGNLIMHSDTDKLVDQRHDLREDYSQNGHEIQEDESLGLLMCVLVQPVRGW